MAEMVEIRDSHVLDLVVTDPDGGPFSWDAEVPAGDAGAIEWPTDAPTESTPEWAVHMRADLDALAPPDQPEAHVEPGVWICPHCQKDTGGLTHYCPPPRREDQDAVHTLATAGSMYPGLSPEGATVLADIVEADRTGVEETESAPAEPPPQAEMPLTGTAPKAPATPPALLPDPAVLDDQPALDALASLGIPTDGMTPAGARDILARRLKDDCPPAVVEATAHAIRKFGPRVPPKGVADWLWRPGLSLGDNPSREVLDAVTNRLSARAVNELHTWPGSERRPFEGGGMDDYVRDELEHAMLVEAGHSPPRLTPAGVKVWEILHGVVPVQSDAQAQRGAGAALAEIDGAGVTADEARAAIKGMQADALKALGAEHADVPVKANMTIGKRRDEIAARLARSGVLPSVLAEMVAKFNAAHPPKVKSVDKPAAAGDGVQDATINNGAAVVPEGE
jgi:hypothetical protein